MFLRRSKKGPMSDLPSGLPGSFKIWGFLLLAAALAFVVAYQFVEPAPPKTLSLAAGPEGGAYYKFAHKYREILSRYGITLAVIPTRGSVENLELLRKGEVALAFVQGGTASASDREIFESLGSLFLEPIWLFTRNEIKLARLADLKGRRVAVGEAGSGTRHLVTQLLEVSGINDQTASLATLGGKQAIANLAEGSLDAVFFVTSPESPLIQALMRDRRFKLFNFTRAQAYGKIFPFLTPATLGEGILDLKDDIPPRDTDLLAVIASLVSRKGLNANLVPALLQTVTDVHGNGGLLEARGQFPSADLVDIPMDEDAGRYLKNGPTFFYRILPYRAAAFLDRTKILILPFAALLFPLFRIGPSFYEWRIRSKIFRSYAVLRDIDRMLQEGRFPEGPEKELQRLNDLEKEVAAVSVPLSYMGDLYDLRMHIGFIAEKLVQHVKKAT